MKDRLRNHWLQVPSRVRKPLVLTIGGSLVILSGLLGWLPGPGGIPLFLVGIAILATEFEWAERFKHYMLDLLKRTGRWLRERPVIMWLIIFLIVCFAVVGSYELHRAISQ